ncbi:MAG: AsmA-like C-terminal region-containing protein [Parvibaculales bacterium]
MPRFPYLSTIFLLLSALAALVIVPNTVPIVPPLAEVEADLSNRFGGAAVIDGNVRLRFIPRPQLIIENVSFSDSRNAPTRVAATIPRLVIDLSIADVAQSRFAIAKATLIEARVQVQLAERPADFLVGLHGLAMPAMDILNGDFRFVGLDPMRPELATTINKLSISLAAHQSREPMLITASKVMPNGQFGQLAMSIGAAANETKITAMIGLGIDEQLEFDGFLSGAEQQWRLDGEIELLSENLLAAAIEARLPFEILPQGRRIKISGLVRGSEVGLRADSLDIEALDTNFRSRMVLNWPRQQGEVPMLNGRLSTGAVNLDLLKPNAAERPAAMLTNIWQQIAPDLSVSVAVEATRFAIGGETGSDLSTAINQNTEELEIERLSLNLPFSASLLASGRFDLRAPETAFNGSFSARSSDTLALLLWLGSQYGTDFSAFAETVDEAKLQRSSVVGDVTLAGPKLALTGLAGRIGDDYFSAEVSLPDMPAQQADIVFRINRFDLADWGIVESAALARDTGMAGLWPQLNRLLADLMPTADRSRKIDFDVRLGRAFAGTRRIGTASLRGSVSNRILRLDELRLPNFDKADIKLSGQLNYDAAPSYGALDVSVIGENAEWLRNPVVARFAPLDFNAELPTTLDVSVELTAPKSPNWPKVIYTGAGEIGGVALNLNMTTPVRSLTLSEGGTDIALALSGAADDLAALFFLPAIYNGDNAGNNSGAMQIGLTAPGNDLFALTADMQLADDRLALNGTLRAAAGGKSLSGALQLNIGHFLPLIDPESGWDKIAAIGEAQITAAPDSLSFSGLDMSLSGAQVSGEGVLQGGEGLPRLNMNMSMQGGDFSWLLPRRNDKSWRDNPLKWSLLGRTNANIEMRGADMQIGEVMLNRLVGRFKLTEGVLEAPQIAAQMMGGLVNANLLAEGGLLAPRFTLSAQFNGLNPSPLITKTYAKRLLEATITGSLNLEGRGTSTRAMMASLTGETNFEISPGYLTFFDAVGFADAVQANRDAGSVTDLVTQYTDAHELAFARGLGLASMRAGVVETASADFVFAEGLNEARLEGAMDLLDMQIDGALSLYPLDRQRPIIWQLSGAAGKPSIKIDASAFNPTAPTPSATQPPAQ